MHITNHKSLLSIILLSFVLGNSSLYAATPDGSENKADIALATLATTSKIDTDERKTSNAVSSHLAFWGLGAALIGFVVMSRRRGI